jgi:hypothetical protein
MSDPVYTIKVTRQRTYSAHHALQHIAAGCAEAAEQDEAGSFNNALIAITLSALSIEAMSNAIGDRIVPRWSDFESAGPLAKVRLLAEHLQMEYAPDSEPWQTLQWLVKFRNRIAHAKPEKIFSESLVQGTGVENFGEKPESKVEAEITPANARKAVNAVEAVKHMLCDRIPAEQRFGLNIDAWKTGMELKP